MKCCHLYRPVAYSPDPAGEGGRVPQYRRHVPGVWQDELRLAELWPGLGLVGMGGVGVGGRVVDILDLERSPAANQGKH